MRKIVAAVALLFWCGVLAYGQAPGPCTSKTLDGVPCFDPNFGVVVRFSPPIPTEKLAPPRPQAPTADTRQAEAPISQQPQEVEQGASHVSGSGQYWIYGKDGSCEFHEGNDVQRFNPSTVQSYGSSS